jgi:hypothetical protein
MDRTMLQLHFIAGSANSDLLACEADVLGERYGDTAESLAAAYGAYARNTVWLAVTDWSDQVIGWSRLLVPGELPEKTLADASKQPWGIDTVSVSAAVGLDAASCWDVATIGVRRELGSQGARAAIALYHGVIVGTRTNRIDWIAAMLHVVVRRVLDNVGLVMYPLPGARPATYMDAPGFIPVYAHVERMIEGQRRTHPDAYRQVVLGQLDGVIAPPAEEYLLADVIDLDQVETPRAV